MGLENIKMVVSEVDGVITDNNAYISEANITMYKKFNLLDFDAINRIKVYWKFVFLSQEAAVNMSICRARNIPFYHAKRSKTEVFSQILKHYSLTPDNVLYVGNTYSDIDNMRMCAYSVCSYDAPAEVQLVASSWLGDGERSMLTDVATLLEEDFKKYMREN